MENHQLALLAANIATTSLTFLKKFSRHERLPAAAPVFDENSENEQQCSICLDDIRGGDRYRKLPECGHAFHAKCIDVWLASHSTCPLCRAQLPQMISLHQNNHYEWNGFVSTFLLWINDFIHKVCNPLNDDLSSMLCASIN